VTRVEANSECWNIRGGQRGNFKVIFIPEAQGAGRSPKVRLASAWWNNLRFDKVFFARAHHFKEKSGRQMRLNGVIHHLLASEGQASNSQISLNITDQFRTCCNGSRCSLPRIVAYLPTVQIYSWRRRTKYGCREQCSRVSEVMDKGW